MHVRFASNGDESIVVDMERKHDKMYWSNRPTRPSRQQRVSPYARPHTHTGPQQIITNCEFDTRNNIRKAFKDQTQMSQLNALRELLALALSYEANGTNDIANISSFR